jgi:hypothetical protein
VNDPESESEAKSDPELSALTTVLNKVRPTVVVRRRVFEAAREQPMAGFVDMDDDEDGPPSSVNVARALATLRGDELRRLEEILSNDPPSVMPMQAAAPVAPTPASTPEPPSVKSFPCGPTITVPELAKRMNVETKDLVTTLVASGYFNTTAKSVLTRANAIAAAWMFGWTVEPVEEEPAPETPKKKSGARKKKG